MIEKFNKWVWESVRDSREWPSYVSQKGQSLGFVVLPDGRKAEVSVSINTDEEEWIVRMMHNYQEPAGSTTNHDNWVVISENVGGSKTRPFIVLPNEPTGRKWRITYEEMKELDI